MHSQEMQRKAFLLLLTVVSVGFGWVIWPFFGAVFWGVVLAILFAPLYRGLLERLGRRRNLASLMTLLVCLLIVILPAVLITLALLQEVASLSDKIRSNEIDFAAWFRHAIDALPDWAFQLLDRYGLTELSTLREKLAASVMQGSQLVAKQAVNFGQNMLGFVVSFGIMLYLLFFLLRDGATLAVRIRQAIPLAPAHKQQLFSRFAMVIRATVKGNIVIAIVQGALGGIMFWILGIQAALLWGVLMAFLSLLPAIGAGLVWGPVAIYFLLTGALWQGVALIVFGVVVIGLIDNLLRPLLVGKDTRMPDYVVLVSTVGGMELFGLHGFVIGPVIAALFIVAWDLFASQPALQDDVG